MPMIIKVCPDCSPRRVEEKSRYYGVGECQACGRADAELHGFSLWSVLGALRSAQEKPSGDLDNVSELFIAIQRGVYRHDVVAVCTTLRLAQELGRASIAVEYDHYHDIEIVKRSLDAAGPEVLVGTLRGRTEDRKFDQALCRSTSTLLGIDWVAGDE